MTKIFIIAHKPVDYGLWNDELYTPIQVGGAPDLEEGILRDNSGNNISDWNRYFAETTATYWINKHVTGCTYLGQCQYRRRLELHDADFEQIFKQYDAICCQPLRYNPYSQFAGCHARGDADDLCEAIRTLYPDMSESVDRYLVHGNILYYSNGYVLRAEDYKAYADFLYNVQRYIMDKRGYTSIEELERQVTEEINCGYRRGNRGLRYQEQIGGFASERAFTCWVQHHCPRRLEIKYKTYEGV